jgi:hypothetical protein
VSPKFPPWWIMLPWQQRMMTMMTMMPRSDFLCLNWETFSCSWPKHFKCSFPRTWYRGRRNAWIGCFGKYEVHLF